MKSVVFQVGWLLLFLVAARGSTFKEDFVTNPQTRNWSVHGDASLFQWSEAKQWLEVTWDSSRSNSYYYRPLGVILTEKDSFGLELDLRLNSIRPGWRPGKPFTFELAFGFQFREEAIRPEFKRGTGQDSSNLLELDYFPAQGVISATVSPTAISKDRVFATGFNYPYDLPLDEWMHITIGYDGEMRRISTAISAPGHFLPAIEDVVLPVSFSGFRVDTVTLSSYSDNGSDGSIHATGQIDNLTVSTPDPPRILIRSGLVPGEIHASLSGTVSSYRLHLERTSDFHQWLPIISQDVSGSMPAIFQDSQPPANQGFYRVRAEKL